jgi:hypothetical protein
MLGGRFQQQACYPMPWATRRQMRQSASLVSETVAPPPIETLRGITQSEHVVAVMTVTRGAPYAARVRAPTRMLSSTSCKRSMRMKA